jgi:hypothetical protein
MVWLQLNKGKSNTAASGKVAAEMHDVAPEKGTEIRQGQRNSSPAKSPFL